MMLVENKQTRSVPFEVVLYGEFIFSIEMNGDIVLRGEKIGNDPALAEFFIEQGKLLNQAQSLWP